MAVTLDQVYQLAADEASIKAAKSVATPKSWANVGQSERAAWGECQGSGKNPYLVQVDLSGPAYSCSCPSPKFPCKHALGLLILLAGGMVDATASQPDRVSVWLQKRDDRAKPKAPAETVPNPQAQAKRASEREAKVAAGLDELERWLTDLVRAGLADAAGKPPKHWDAMSARLIDAQASGLARMVRDLGGTAQSGPGWQSRFMAEVGKIYLLVQSYRNQQAAPLGLVADIRAAVGWATKEADLPGSDVVKDTWVVLGTSTEMDNNLLAHREWLTGVDSHREALLLTFSHPSQPKAAVYAVGSLVNGSLTFFPSATPLRAAASDDLVRSGDIAKRAPEGESIAASACRYRERLALNPWFTRAPMLLESATLIHDGDAWIIADDTGTLPVIESGSSGASIDESAMYRLAAVTGGHPAQIFCAYDGKRARPLTTWYDGECYAVSDGGEDVTR